MGLTKIVDRKQCVINVHCINLSVITTTPNYIFPQIKKKLQKTRFQLQCCLFIEIP